MIDINQPVKQGSDMVLNYDGGESVLGSASGFAREAAAGKLMSLPPNDNPNGDVNPPDGYDSAPVDKSNGRNKNGHFLQ
jgi:hypothetical protein